MNHQSSAKWSFWQTILLLIGIVMLIGVSTFLAMMLMQHYPNPDELWAMATNMFTLFGLLLGVGVAFALLAAAVSFLALNQKLYEAQSYLAQARLHLDDYKQLSHQENLIQDKIHQLIKYHQSLLLTPVNTNSMEVEPILSLSKQITTSEFANFEARLLARTIEQDIYAKQAVHLAQNQPSIYTWRDAMQQFEQASYLWQAMLSASSDNLLNYIRNNYLSAKLYQATATQHLAMLNGTAQQNAHYRQLDALYAPVLALNGASKDAQTNHLISQAAYQNAMLAYQEGEILWQENQNIESVSHKWYEAKQSFQAAFQLQRDDAEIPYQYGSLLEREARLIAQTDAQRLPEARQLWLQAREQYRLALDIQPKKPEALLNWGNTFADEATAIVQTNADTLPEARILWQNAREKFQQTLEIQPNFDAAAYNAGMTLNKEADIILHLNQNVDEVCQLWQQAGERFQAALSINPSRYDVVNSWGLVLAKEADLRFKMGHDNLPQAQKLWQSAQQRFHHALELEPELQAAATNWRTVLTNESNVVNQTNRKVLWQTASDKIASLRQMSPNHAASESIKELADVIQQQLLKVESMNQLQPVGQLRSTVKSE